MKFSEWSITWCRCHNQSHGDINENLTPLCLFEYDCFVIPRCGDGLGAWFLSDSDFGRFWLQKRAGSCLELRIKVRIGPESYPLVSVNQQTQYSLATVARGRSELTNDLGSIQKKFQQSFRINGLISDISEFERSSLDPIFLPTPIWCLARSLSAKRHYFYVGKSDFFNRQRSSNAILHHG